METSLERPQQNISYLKCQEINVLQLRICLLVVLVRDDIKHFLSQSEGEKLLQPLDCISDFISKNAFTFNSLPEMFFLELSSG